MAASNQQETLRKIEKRFEELYKQYGEVPIRRLENTSNDDVQNDLKTWGICVIGDAVNSGDYKYNKNLNIRELSAHLFGTENPFDNEEFKREYNCTSLKYLDFPPEEKILATMISGWWQAKEGFGNMNFRFLYFQFLKKNPTFEIGGETVEFSRNPFHRHQLRLLASKPKLWELLKAQHSSGRPMVSWDSQKVRFHDVGRDPKGYTRSRPKATKPGLTKRHTDIYKYGGADLDRIQAMLIEQSPKAISLGWVMFSNDPEIRRLIAEYFGKEPGGFSSVEDEHLNKIIDRYWIGPLGGFVIWAQPTIHYEAVPDPKTRRFKSFDQPTANLPEFSFRAVIGTHTPVDLSHDDLVKLALISEFGYAPAIYKGHHKNEGTNVHKNVVNPKSTQYQIARGAKVLENEELERLRNVFDSVETSSDLTRFTPMYKDVNNYKAHIIKEMYGLYDVQSVAEKYNLDEQKVKMCINSTSEKYGISQQDVIHTLLSEGAGRVVQSNLGASSSQRNKNYLVFGVGERDYDAWKLKASDDGAYLIVFAQDNHNNHIPESEIILGDFNDIVEMDKLPNRYYDKIFFADATMKFASWYGIHLAIISQKLNEDGELYLPVEGGGIREFASRTFEEILERINQNTYRDLKEQGPTMFSGEMLPVYTENEVKYASLPTRKLFLGANRPMLVVNENDRRLKGNEETRDKYNEFYRKNNRFLLEQFFENVEELGYYPSPQQRKVKTWFCSRPKIRKYSHAERKMIEYNLKMKK